MILIPLNRINKQRKTNSKAFLNLQAIQIIKMMKKIIKIYTDR